VFGLILFRRTASSIAVPVFRNELSTQQSKGEQLQSISSQDSTFSYMLRTRDWENHMQQHWGDSCRWAAASLPPSGAAGLCITNYSLQINDCTLYLASARRL